jgi:hypothetical protein
MNILVEERVLTFFTMKRSMYSLNLAGIRRLCFLDRFLMGRLVKTAGETAELKGIN